MIAKTLPFALLVACLSSATSFAAEESIPVLTIKDHQFDVTAIKVKAGERFKLKIVNADSTSEEFESNSMIIEKFIGPKKSIVVNLGPLKPGTYEYFGDFHPSSAKGTLTAE